MHRTVIKTLFLVTLAFAPVSVSAEINVRDVARKIASSLSQKHDQAKTVLLQTSANQAFNDYFTVNDPAKKRAAKDVIDKVMLDVSRIHNAGEMCLIGAGGPELARVQGGHIAHDLDPNETDNEFFGPAMAQEPKSVYVAHPYISHDAEKWVIAYATPIAFSGQTRAILHYEMSLKFYQDILRQGDEAQAHIMLISSDGWILGDNRTEISVDQVGEKNKPEAYFKKFKLYSLDLDGLKNKLRGGVGRLGPDDKAVSVAWHAVPGDATVVVVEDPVKR